VLGLTQFSLVFVCSDYDNVTVFQNTNSMWKTYLCIHSFIHSFVRSSKNSTQHDHNITSGTDVFVESSFTPRPGYEHQRRQFPVTHPTACTKEDGFSLRRI